MTAINYDPSLPTTTLLINTLTKSLNEILIAQVPAMAAFVASKTYLAIQSGTLTGTPEDLGVVRYVTEYRTTHTPNPHYEKIKLDNPDSDVALFLGSSSTLQFTLNIPAIGQIRAYVKQVTTNGTFSPANVKIEFESTIGTLYVADVIEIIEQIKAIDLLGAPQISEAIV